MTGLSARSSRLCPIPRFVTNPLAGVLQAKPADGSRVASGQLVVQPGLPHYGLIQNSGSGPRQRARRWAGSAETARLPAMICEMRLAGMSSAWTSWAAEMPISVSWPECGLGGTIQHLSAWLRRASSDRELQGEGPQIAP